MKSKSDRQVERKRKAVLKSLMEQLERKKAVTAYFTDMVEDYMSLWEIKEKMIKDVAENGLIIHRVNGNGIDCEIDNPFVKQIPNYNKQMLSLLKQLGLETNNVIADTDDEDAGL